MAIVVEDGTVVANANSYLSIADVTAFALARGVVVPPGDAEKQLLLAADYIHAREAKFLGARTSGAQTLPWPRTAGGSALGVPQKIRDAQAFIVMAQVEGVDVVPLDAEADAFAIKSEKVGPLETVYAVPDGAAPSALPKVAVADDLLAYYYAGIPGIRYRYLGKT